MWDQEYGWGVRVWNKKLINKKYFPSECAFLFQVFQRDKCGVRDISAVLKHKGFGGPEEDEFCLAPLISKLCRVDGTSISYILIPNRVIAPKAEAARQFS